LTVVCLLNAAISPAQILLSTMPISNNVEGCSHGLFEGTIAAFAQRN